ncbi:MAG: hypothetical protein WCB46_05795 [Methanoregula sp.]
MQSTLDQIIAERDLRTYDEAIVFLITERKRNLPSDFGVFSDIEEYVCNGEDSPRTVPSPC